LLSGFSIAFAPDTNEIYLAAGDEFVDPIFGRFSIVYNGLDGYDVFEEMLSISGSTSAEMRFYNYDGTYVEIPLAADSATVSGEASDEPIYWGNEAPTATKANQDELIYLEGETCFGVTSVVDCQGAMFLVIDSDGNVHLSQITNIDTNANEISFDDLTYGGSGDNVPYTDGSVTDFDTGVGTLQLLIDEATKTITFTDIGSEDGTLIRTYNEATFEIINTDVSSQIFEGVYFSEYNDGARETEKYLENLLIIAYYDDITANSIEWSSTSLLALNSSDGFGFFDVSDTIDAYQDFVTYKGTLIEYDRESKSYIYFYHPYYAVYANVTLEST
ncbi:hypothetical protein HZA99_05245, partial [Candidatus Woesearchaeota archaeon]|nr:hypothetical protein [Candidatus Woesearchaeota archaeon]